MLDWLMLNRRRQGNEGVPTVIVDELFDVMHDLGVTSVSAGFHLGQDIAAVLIVHC